MQKSQLHQNFTNRLHEEVMILLSRTIMRRRGGAVWVRHIKFHSLVRRAMAGEKYDRAEKLAQDWLQFAEQYKNENPYAGIYYGEAIHFSHMSLGRICAHRGEIEKAKQHLLDADRTPGSPRLDSYGPSMKLAKELIEKGEKEVVILYLNLVAKFWAKANPKSQRLQLEKKALLKQWKAEVRAGKVPNHEMWH
jgi:hypothetical protein